MGRRLLSTLGDTALGIDSPHRSLVVMAPPYQWKGDRTLARHVLGDARCFVPESNVARRRLPRVARMALALQVRRVVGSTLSSWNHVVDISAPCLMAFSADRAPSQYRCTDPLPLLVVATSSCTGAGVSPRVQLTSAVTARPSAFRAGSWRSCGQPGSWMRKSGTTHVGQCRRDSCAASAGTQLCRLSSAPASRGR